MSQKHSHCGAKWSHAVWHVTWCLETDGKAVWQQYKTVSHISDGRSRWVMRVLYQGTIIFQVISWLDKSSIGFHSIQ